MLTKCDLDLAERSFRESNHDVEQALDLIEKEKAMKRLKIFAFFSVLVLGIMSVVFWDQHNQ